MKKTYIVPALDVEFADVTEMLLAASVPGVGIDRDGSVDAGELDAKGQAWDIWGEN